MNTFTKSSPAQTLKNAFRLAFYGLYLYSFYLLLVIIFQYIPYHPDVAFLRIKQQFVDIPYYLPAFYIHVYSSGFILLAGFTQFQTNLLRKWPKVHRYAGWLYIASILLLSAPSGLLIGFHAFGGWSARLAFTLLAVLWIYTTFMAYKHAQQKNFVAHRNFMCRSFALSLSAITLRWWKFVLVALFHPRPVDVYQVIAWLGWVLNLAVAELIIYKKRKP